MFYPQVHTSTREILLVYSLEWSIFTRKGIGPLSQLPRMRLHRGLYIYTHTQIPNSVLRVCQGKLRNTVSHYLRLEKAPRKPQGSQVLKKLACSFFVFFYWGDFHHPLEWSTITFGGGEPSRSPVYRMRLQRGLYVHIDKKHSILFKSLLGKAQNLIIIIIAKPYVIAWIKTPTKLHILKNRAVFLYYLQVLGKFLLIRQYGASLYMYIGNRGRLPKLSPHHPILTKYTRRPMRTSAHSACTQYMYQLQD